MTGDAYGGTMADGPMPPSVVGNGGIAPMHGGRGNVGGRCTAPLCGRRGSVYGGSTTPCVTTGLAWMVTTGGGNWLMTVCMTVPRLLATLWVTG